MRPTRKFIKKPVQRPTECFYCVNAIDIDYKDVDTFKRSISSYAKILPRRRTGTCSKHQRLLAGQVKRSRFLGFIRYTNK